MITLGVGSFFCKGNSKLLPNAHLPNTHEIDIIGLLIHRWDRGKYKF